MIAEHITDKDNEIGGRCRTEGKKIKKSAGEHTHLQAHSLLYTVREEHRTPSGAGSFTFGVENRLSLGSINRRDACTLYVNFTLYT